MTLALAWIDVIVHGMYKLKFPMIFLLHKFQARVAWKGWRAHAQKHDIILRRCCLPALLDGRIMERAAVVILAWS
jgi:hypothetical protein